MPTLTQLAPLLRIFAPLAVGFLTKYVGADNATQLVSLALSFAGAGAWSLYANTQGSLAQTVASFKGATVHVDPSADPSLKKLAADPTVKDVIPAPLPAIEQPYRSSR